MEIGRREVKNRIVSTAHATGFGEDGVLTDRYVRYHERKAAGGAGLIMTFGSASVYRESAASYGSVSLWDPENEPFLRDLADRVHAHGALIMSQATHMGRRGSSLESGRPLQAPSAVPEPVHREIPHVLRTEEIPPIVEAFAEAAARVVGRGYTALKFDPFGDAYRFISPAELRRSLEIVGAVREAVGPEIDLMVDVNNAWDSNTAIRFGRMIERYEPYWLEEPTPADDYRGQAALCTALDVPVASGENEFTRWGFRDLLEARAVDIVQADPRTCGGFTEWLKIAALASAYHLPMAPHGGPHVGAHCVGAVSNGLIVESYVHSIQAHLNEFVSPPDIRDGYVTLPDRPGLGLQWNEEAIKRRLGS
jgi:L-alanine-DL-glutamate epimerase-like enolase superfamily enzyme